MTTARWALCTVLLAALTATPAAADPDSGTLTDTITELEYSGGPYTGANPSNNIQAEPDCGLVPDSCDDYILTIDLPSGYTVANPGKIILVTVGWSNPADDFDVYFQDPTDGRRVADPAASSANPEIGVLSVQDGVTQVRIRILVFNAAAGSFDATIQLVDGVFPRLGTYAASTDIWSCNSHLIGLSSVGNPPTVFNHSGDGEPAMGFNKNGKLFLGAIAGLPAGNGFWTQNDVCAQANNFYGAVDAGIGGGDIDIEVAPEPNVLGNYNVYTSSLTLANITSSFSFDDGVTFTSITPVSTPSVIDDRQWNAAHGSSITYLSYRQGLTQPGNKLEVVRLDYSGLVNPVIVGPFPVWSPDQLLLGHDLGNITTDRRSHADNFSLMGGPDGEGNVYHGYVEQTGRIMVGVSKDFGVTWTNHTVSDGGPGADFTFWFTWVTVDTDGNVYTSWSDSANIYYAVSKDQGITWSTPVRVNRQGESRTCIYAQIQAISPGKLVFAFYGHDGNGPGDPFAVWKVFMARTSNALDPVPHFEERIVTDRVFHTGSVCFNGLGCACCRELLECFDVDINPVDGGAAIVYGAHGSGPRSGSWVTRQLSGESFVDGRPPLARDQQCPSPENDCTSTPPVGDPCSCPGVLTVADLDEEDAPPAPNAATNIEFVAVAEPFGHPAGPDAIGFSVVVKNIDPKNLPLNTFWRAIFTAPDAVEYFVQVRNCAENGEADGTYGDFEVGARTLGPLDAFEIRDDGTICMWIDRSLVGNPQPGQTITAINAECSLVTGVCSDSPVNAQLDVTNSGQYTVVGNDFCRAVPVLVESMRAIPANGGVDVSWQASSSTDIRAFHLYRALVGNELERVHTVPMGSGGRFLFHDASISANASYELFGELSDGSETFLARTSVVGVADAFAFAVNGSPLRAGSATFRYHLPERAEVDLKVFDVAGRHVATVVEEAQVPGAYAVSFERTRSGKKLAAGIYLVKFEAGEFSERTRLVILD